MSKVRRLFGFKSKLLENSVVREEVVGGVLFCPALNTQLIINRDLFCLLVSLFVPINHVSKALDNLGWTKDSAEKLLLNGLTATYKNRKEEKEINNLAETFKLGAPVQLIVEVTNRCNQRCNFCYAADGTRQKMELSTKELKKIADQAAEMGVFRIHLMGGEPLVRGDTLDIISHISNLGMFVSLTTNGTLLERVVLDLGKIPNLLPLQVSIHSTRRSVYKKYGIQPENLDVTKKNCLTLKENRIPFGLKSVISEHNYFEVFALTQLAQELGAGNITFLNMLPLGRGKNKGNEGNLRRYLEKIILDLEKAEKLPIHVDYRSFLGVYFPKKPKTAIERFVDCPSGSLDMRIRSDGVIIQCSAVRREMFDLKKISLSEAWEGFMSLKKPCPFQNCGYFATNVY